MTSEQRPNSTGFDVCYLCLANCVAKWFMTHGLVRSLTSDLLLIFMSQVTMRASKMSLRSSRFDTRGVSVLMQLLLLVDSEVFNPDVVPYDKARQKGKRTFKRTSGEF